jgi:hypothetical protein
MSEILTMWTWPDNYIGSDWNGYYIGPCTMNRDSSPLECSNFDALIMEIPESETVVIVQENHWAVGWVKWLAIHKDDASAIRKAEDIARALENYPVLDEDDLSEREWECYQESWDLWGEKEYRAALACAVEISRGKMDWTEDEIEEAMMHMDIDDLIHNARQHVSWEYQIEGQSCTINIDGLVGCTTKKDAAAQAVEYMWGERREKDLRDLCRYLGLDPRMAGSARRRGIDSISGLKEMAKEWAKPQPFV